MIPVGYMYKTVSQKPDRLKTDRVFDIYSVSGCISEDFADWIKDWKHNGYWFFNSPCDIEALAKKRKISLQGMKLFFYRAYELQWNGDREAWEPYSKEESFLTEIEIPQKTTLEGFDIVSFSCGTSAECSPLSCNQMAEEISVNLHCLLDSFEEAKRLVETGNFRDCEPGPYRIFQVHTV